MPNLLNEEGVLFLINENGEVLTKSSYNENEHNEFLEDEKGISLERVNLQSDRWISGNSSKGKASVGYLNDGFTTSSLDKIKISLSENHYSLSQNHPLALVLDLGDGDYWGEVTLLTKLGLKVKELFSDHHFSAHDELELSELSGVSRLGIYVILFEFRHPKYGIVRKRVPLAVVE